MQVHHYFALTGLRVGLLACLVSGQRLEVRTVHRDESIIEAMLEREARFLDFVRSDTPPPPDGSQSAHDAIRALHPDANGKTVRLSRDQWRDVRELRQRRDQRKEIERQEAELQQRLELAMGDAEHAVSPYDTPAARFASVVSKRFDTTAFRKDHAALYDEYAVAKPTRRFTLE
jgi:predicted phage-related endonuclease